MSLEEYQERVERRFESIARFREGLGFPVFALEHGLADEEIKEISSLLRENLESRPSLSSHWLLWVIYATEAGYSYNGDEYWPSFKSQTPEWEFDRYEFIRLFTRFRDKYDGVRPSGAWAEHFRIIAWPITHAILPRYLQNQFARALFDLRFSLAGMDVVDPFAIGRMLAANVPNASSRFREFLQQEELTGRIVLALFDEDPVENREPINPQTLGRIVADLGRVRNARDWLRNTHQVVADRFRGIGKGLRPSEPGKSGDRMSRERTPFAIRPSMVLGHRGENRWSLRLDVPSFRSVASIGGDIHSFLKSTRCRLNGASDFKTAGWLLSGNRKAALKSWPDPQKPLIIFEHPNGKIENILEGECRCGPGPFWLFKIGRDGIAREIKRHVVRPECDYLFLSTEELPEPHSFTSSCEIDCEGVKAVRLMIPDTVSAEETEWFREWELQVARTIRVWPSGLPGRDWDGEGGGSWLTTENPCFGILHDHAVDAYEFRVNGGEWTVIEAGELGCPVFVRIARLPAGNYMLSVRARRDPSLETVAETPAAEGFVQLDVREPEPWGPETPSRSGMSVNLSPHDADLDLFWRNEVELLVTGPESHSVTFTVSLEDSHGKKIFSKRVDGHFRLPVSAGTWNDRFCWFLEQEKLDWKYMEASVCRLEIDGEELGKYVLRFERDTLPLRWVLSRYRSKTTIRLVDDTGLEETDPEISFFPMERPVEPQSLTSGESVCGISEPGRGLFVARKGKDYDAVILSIEIKFRSFGELELKPEFPEFLNGSDTMAEALRLSEFWRTARSYGPLAGIRQKKISGSILDAVCLAICAKRWLKAETAFLDAKDSADAFGELERSVERKNSRFASALSCCCLEVKDEDFSLISDRYSALAAKHSVCGNRELCDFALALAGGPDRFPRVLSHDLDKKLGEIRKNPTVLRGARFIAIVLGWRT